MGFGLSSQLPSCLILDVFTLTVSVIPWRWGRSSEVQLEDTGNTLGRRGVGKSSGIVDWKDRMGRELVVAIVYLSGGTLCKGLIGHTLP